MGLDGVELVLAFEERFGVEISDGEAEKLVTPGMVIDLLCTKLTLTDETTCQSQRAFYLLRRAGMNVLSRQRQELTPDTKLEDLSSSKDCTAWWIRIKEEVDARSWPEPTRPYWMEQTIFFLTLAVLFGLPVLLYERGNPRSLVPGILFGCMAAVALPVLLVAATKRWRKRVPRDIKTMRDLIPYVATSDSIQWNRDLVAQIVKDIVIRVLSLDESKYSEDAHFIEDLGVG